MRKAAGIILIILGMIGLIGLVRALSDSGVDPSSLGVILWRIASGALLVIGGVFCLRRRYWPACLASALLALFIGISSTISSLQLPPPVGPLFMTWGTWIMIGGAAISTIFIIRRRKDWQKSQS